MKKNVIAVLLSFVMAVGSVGAVPVFAAEEGTTEVIAEEKNVEGEETAEEDIPEEELAEENIVEAVLDETDDPKITENVVIPEETLEYASEAMSEGTTEEIAEEHLNESDREVVMETTVEDETTEGIETAVPTETTQDTQGGLSPEDYRALQEKVKIWKYQNSVTIVFNSPKEEFHPGYRILSERSGEQLSEGTFQWDEKSKLYFSTVDVDALNTNNQDIPLQIVVSVGENQVEEFISTEIEPVTITNMDTETTGQLVLSWDVVQDVDGYSIMVQDSTVRVYETTENKFTLDITEENNSSILIAPYRYDTGSLTDVKQYAEASLISTAEFEEQTKVENEVIVSDQVDSETVSSDNKMAGEVSGTCGDNLTWTLNDGTLTISGTGEMDDYGYEDAPWYDSRTTITAITIENGVTYIGNTAFYLCINLTSVSIPQSVMCIGVGSFQNCLSLASVTIPDTVKSIGRDAFSACTSLTSVTIPDGIVSIEDYTFNYCEGLTNVTIPDSVKSIGNFAFSRCTSLMSVTIPDGVTSIGNSAFSRCTNLMNVTILDGVMSIGDYAFSSCDKLTSMTIPSSVTTIGDWAFSYCSNLTSISILDGVTSIGNYAFYNCFSLTSVTIPDSVTNIGALAFHKCRLLQEISLPAALTYLGDEAFLACSQLSRVILPDQQFEAGDNVFLGCADSLQFLSRDLTIQEEMIVGEKAAVSSDNQNGQNYTISNSPVYSYLINEDTRLLRVEYNNNILIREYYSLDGNLLNSKIMPLELPWFGGFYKGEDSYYLVFGQPNYEEDDNKEVIRVVRYSKDWERLGIASIYGANTTFPFSSGTVSLTEINGILYLRTSHKMYTSDDGKRHQANLTATIRESDMSVTWIFSKVANTYYGYVSHSFNQIICTDGEDIIAADHGDAYPRAIVLFRYGGEAGAEKLSEPDNVQVLPIAGTIDKNETGASLGALEVSSTHYLVAGNSVVQEDESFDPNSVRNIFVTATNKENFSSNGTTLRWITSYKGDESVSTPVMVALPNDRYILMWTVDEVLKYCFIGPDGSLEGSVYSGVGKLSDCKPYVKDNSVCWYVTYASGPVFYYIRLDAPTEVHVRNPRHTLVLDAMGGTLDESTLDVEHGSKYPDLPTPEREAGYEFLGWYTAKNGGNKITSDMIARVRSSETLYAHWVRHWSFDESTGILTLFDIGSMKDYAAKWNSLKNNVKKVILSNGLTSIRNYAFEDYGSLTSVTIPESVTYIGESAFKGCSSLKSITIPKSVTYIGGFAFGECSSLKGITIPESVTYIGNSAFERCSSLTSVTIPASVTSIGGFAFERCSSLTSVTIPPSVTSINGWTFCECSNLKSITIPDSVTSIGKAAFAFCGSLTDVYYAGSQMDWSAISMEPGNWFLTDANLHCAKTISIVDNVTITGIASKTYTGKALTQTPVITFDGVTLTKDLDYTVSYANNINVGTAEVTIKGKGNYSGTITKYFTINKAANKITAANRTMSYSTKARTIAINAKATAGKITYKSSNTKVKVTISGKVTVPAKFTGTTKITITAAGNNNYNKGSKTITITVPTKATLSRVISPAAGKMKVTWKKNTTVTGYQIQYSLKSSFASPKTKNITKNTTISATIGGLKKGKKYYVRIRSYKTISGKAYYSAWSTSKATTIKK